MTELICTWASLAPRSSEPRGVVGEADDVLLAGWRNAPDKGAYVDRLPPLEAARLCDLLNAGEPRRGRPVTTRPKRRD